MTEREIADAIGGALDSLEDITIEDSIKGLTRALAAEIMGNPDASAREQMLGEVIHNLAGMCRLMRRINRELH